MLIIIIDKGGKRPYLKSQDGRNLKLTVRQTEFSSWFLPGYGQWVAVLKGMVACSEG